MGFISWYNDLNKRFQDGLGNVVGGFVHAVQNIGSDPAGKPGTGSGNPLPEIINEVKSGDLLGAGEAVYREIIDESASLIVNATDSGKDAVEWVDNTVVDPAIDAGKDAVEWVDNTVVDPALKFVKSSWDSASDWASDNIKNPISKTWNKYKIPILAGAGAIVAIKILK